MIVAALGAPAQPALARSSRAELQSTVLISRSLSGGIPNGPSTHPVISNDRRWARVIAFESEASDLVPGDTNGVKDVFVIQRAGVFHNDGTMWFGNRARRVSRPRAGGQANGPSWGAAVSGAFRKRPRCVAFLSSATNLVPRDTNGKVDAFVTRLNGTGIRRLPLPGNRQANVDTTSVAVSGDCTRISFSAGGVLYTRSHGRTKRIGYGVDPSYSTGLRNLLVYSGSSGVYLSRGGTRRGRLLVRGGRNPALNDIKWPAVAYEKFAGGHWQVMVRHLGHGHSVCRRARFRGPHPVSSHHGHLGNGNSGNPVIGNSGCYITFESDASNLGTNANSSLADFNGRPDAYLYTNVRNITLVQSVFEKGIPLNGGGFNPSMSFYANYIVFDSPAPMGRPDASHQIFMRYLGPV